MPFGSHRIAIRRQSPTQLRRQRFIHGMYVLYSKSYLFIAVPEVLCVQEVEEAECVYVY